jgi:hypothetical protein
MSSIDQSIRNPGREWIHSFFVVGTHKEEGGVKGKKKEEKKEMKRE